MSTTQQSISNPFTWNKPFAFLWLTADQSDPTQIHFIELIESLCNSTNNYCSELEDKSSVNCNAIEPNSKPFLPHITLHTTHLDQSNVVKSMCSIIDKVKMISSPNSTRATGDTLAQDENDSTDHTSSPLLLKLSGPLVGVTHFKSVYLDVLENDHYHKLLELKSNSILHLGPNVPKEAQYLPHLSLWYGTNDTLKNKAYQMAIDDQKVASENSTSPQVCTYPVSTIDIVYAPHIDVRSWYSVGCFKIGSDKFVPNPKFAKTEIDSSTQSSYLEHMIGIAIQEIDNHCKELEL